MSENNSFDWDEMLSILNSCTLSELKQIKEVLDNRIHRLELIEQAKRSQ